MLPEELLKRLKSDQSPAIVDVRTGFEYRAGHIPGAIHAPNWKILLHIADLPSDRNAELVVTCEHGPRAILAKALLQAFGYQRVSLLEGHMADWREAERPQEK